MPKEFSPLKTRLEKMKAPTLTVDQYRVNCETLGLSNAVLQTSLLDLWDKLGNDTLLPESSDDAPSMQETAILNPGMGQMMLCTR